MATCKECLHYEACMLTLKAQGVKIPEGYKWSADRCNSFKTAADYVHVTRCKDCEHGLYMDSCSMYLCRCTGGKLRYADNYCNYGERKDTDEQHS